MTVWLLLETEPTNPDFPVAVLDVYDSEEMAERAKNSRDEYNAAQRAGIEMSTHIEPFIVKGEVRERSRRRHRR